MVRDLWQSLSAVGVVHGVEGVCVIWKVTQVGRRPGTSGSGQMYYEVIKAAIMDHARAKGKLPNRVFVSQDLAKKLIAETRRTNGPHQCFQVPWTPSAQVPPEYIALWWDKKMYLNIRINIDDSAG